MNREQYIEHLRNVALGLHIEGIQNWADLIVDNLHWVKEKTLTDEEIAKLADDILGYQIYGYKESGVYEFARAILRKAQEK
jgi:hypothetical protein